MATRTRTSDYTLLTYFVVLILFGLLVLSSAGVSVGIERFQDPYFFIKRQLLLGLLPGVILFLIAAKIDYHVWKKYALPIFIAGLILLILPFIPGIGSTHGTGARSWIVLGGNSFQPAEAIKLGMIIFMAAFLSNMGKQIYDLKHGFLVALGVGLIPIVMVIAQPDIGTTFILFSILIFLLFFANAKFSHLSALGLVAIIAFILMIIAAPYRAQRLTTFLHPELDPQGQGYQINQAFLAIGSGGVFGLGLGHSRQKFQYLPEVHADSIFAIASEEFGIVIIGLFLALLVLITLRVLHIAKHSPDSFGRLLVAGIISWFIIQSLLNIGAMVGLLPLTGVPLPFVSHGGSALMIGMVGMGIIINVSKYSSAK
ncbi:putative lipid II flippase FtsW [Candidatus Parcubacteria bacterium]|jgi:cell division protein FtsW|nr:putative lipid II flippase FtsW [Candidatus Parcubacteria bacterium]